MIIKIQNKNIGDDNPCFVIAEAGVNHNGNLELAKKLVDAAKTAGVDAVKFQTFKSEEIVTPDAQQAKYQAENIRTSSLRSKNLGLFRDGGKKESQYTMLKRLELSYNDFRELKNYCDEAGIMFLSTPHSCKDDVDLVAELCPAIKVGSGDLTNLPILKYMVEKNLPIILSTGMASMEEIREGVDAILPINQQLILLHCTTNYPTELNEVNLKAMQAIEQEFNLPTGYSDHTEGINVSLAAVAMGACMIEKHFTLDRTMEGSDHKASLEPDELKQLVDGIRNIEYRMQDRTQERIANGENKEKIVEELNIAETMGDGLKKPNPSEIEVAKIARKSVVAAININAGEIISENMLKIKRPGIGILPKFLNEIIGKKAKENILKDELIAWEKLS